VPELPEVETVRRALARAIVDRKIAAVAGHRVQMRRPLDPVKVDNAMRGRRLAEPRRRGKFLLLDLDPPGTLLIHLGMSGRLLLVPETDPILPHTHLVVLLDDGRHLRLVDPRRFGLAWWLDPGEESDDPSLALLGMEPLDERLVDVLPPLLRAHRSPIKALLLDQRLVAGVGNIYATEALWRAGIRPSRRGDRTSLGRLRRLVAEVQAVLREAIEQGGTTIRDYSTPSGDFGSFAVRLQVYGRAGLPCRRCGTTLRDLRIGNRSTAWCPRCQT
jgi:formamidopyrimidine-DNA glycosylase